MNYNNPTSTYLQPTIMRSKTKITASEKELFRQSVKKVKPLAHTKSFAPIMPAVKKMSAKARAIENDSIDFNELEDLPNVSSHDHLQFARSGIPHKTLRTLKLGQYTIEAVLDLHGKTVAKAAHSLNDFLHICQQEKIRHALIIHGKGQKNETPILKNKLNHWLRQTEQVLAFNTAKPKDGDTGALYVLLKIIKSLGEKC